MKILGFSSGSHDSSYCIMDNGEIVLHEESERITRIKECYEDPLLILKNRGINFEDFDIVVTYPHADPSWYPKSLSSIIDMDSNGKLKFIKIGHHLSHAANAHYSSGYEKSLSLTLDGGGWDFDEDFNLVASTFTSWLCDITSIVPIEKRNDFNLGWAWSSLTKEVFKMSGGGPPYGSEAGTVMAMASFGDPERYYDLLKYPIYHSQIPILNNMSEKDMFDFAASLQKTTENLFFNIIEQYLNKYNINNICLSGGVILNCVMCGNLFDKFRGVNFYVPPVPFDAGCAIGCCQYVWHNILRNENNFNQSNRSAYLGREYSISEVLEALSKFNIEHQMSSDDYVLNLLNSQNIIAIYGGRSESGRRALGNRSIIADPRSCEMKDKINQKVKHRKSFRPFAPSVLREKISDWFVHDIDSPYMSFAIKFKNEMHKKVPAVNHVDNTARIQTVSKKDNEWFHGFIKKWETISGVPILLNTSFNDKEPIVETPQDAIKCFLKTEIDYLYFRDFGILIKKGVQQ